MEIKAISVSEANRQRLLDDCYTTGDITVIELYQGMLEAKHNAQTGAIICDTLNKFTQQKLTFKQWAHENVYALDEKGVAHVIVGGWYGERYVPRGLVKQTRKGKRFLWLTNGQASTGSVQVAMYAEDAEVQFPEFEKIAKLQLDAINCAACRRSERVSTYILECVVNNSVPPDDMVLQCQMTQKQALELNRKLMDRGLMGWRYKRVTPNK